MSKLGNIELKDDDPGLAGLLPTIPDMLGFVLVFLLAWAVYTVTVGSLTELKVTTLSADEVSEPTASVVPVTDSTRRTRRPLKAAQKVIDSTIADVSESVSHITRKLADKAETSMGKAGRNKSVDRF